MKTKKIMLLPLLLYSGCLMANDTLADALSNGKVNGEVKAVFVSGSDTDVGVARGSDNKKVGSIALALYYLSDEYKGFNLGISAQAGHDFGLHDYDGSSEDDARNSVSTALMHEAYIKYSLMKSNLKIGRQIIRTPMILNSSAFALIDSFDAITMAVNEIPDTKILLMYIQEWNRRYGNDSNGTITQEDVHYKDPVLSLYLRNNSIPNLTVDAQYMTTNQEGNNGDLPIMTTDGYDEYFVRANYKIENALPINLEAMYGGASFDLSTEKDASFYGVKISTLISGLKLDLSYSSVDEDNDFPGTLGHVPDTLVYGNMLVTDAVYAGLDSISLEAAYNITQGFNAKLKYTNFNQSEEGMNNSSGIVDNANEVDLDLKYTFDGQLKGLSALTKLAYAKYDVDVQKDDITYGRLYLIYKF